MVEMTATEGLVYLVSCALNKAEPDRQLAEKMDLEKIYAIAKKHSLTAICGHSLRRMELPESEVVKRFSAAHSQNSRRVLLFRQERMALCDFFEAQGIRHMELKGSKMEDYYPMGCREMADNDILIDGSRAEQVRGWFEGRGYLTESYGKCHHDVYMKKPVFNFEIHRELVGRQHNEEWQEYYRDVFARLIPDEGKNFAYHFSDEDFYIYLMFHAYKHYKSSGTGIRNLADCYLYDRSHDLDRGYLDREFEKLGIPDYERRSRKLAVKLFSDPSKTVENIRGLDPAEREMLSYYVSSGTYGTMNNRISNELKEVSADGGKPLFWAKIRLIWQKIFLPKKLMEGWCEENAAFFCRHRNMMWFAPIYRLAVKLMTDRQKGFRIVRMIFRSGK